MRLQQILGGLTPAEKSALKVLDESGRWALMYDAALEDGWSPGGQRSRTFQKKGRYSLIVMFDPGKPNPSTGLFAEPEPEPEIVREPIRFRPVPWIEEPLKTEAEPEPIVPLVDKAEIKVFEVSETEIIAEPEPEKPYRSHHKKPEAKVKKKHK